MASSKKPELSPELPQPTDTDIPAAEPDLGARALPAAIAHEVANLGITPHATISTE